MDTSFLLPGKDAYLTHLLLHETLPSQNVTLTFFLHPKRQGYPYGLKGEQAAQINFHPGTLSEYKIFIIKFKMPEHFLTFFSII